VLRVALTGGIATGKSYVRARVASRGVPTVDADAVVHALLAAGTDATDEVVRRFGAAMRGADGSVDRKTLGAVIFADASARGELEAILHPRVYAEIEKWAVRQARAGARWVLADIPLLFETGHEADFDRVVVAACAPEEQVRRVMQRDGLSESAARGRLAAQWPIARKVERATDVVDTGGTFDDTDRQVDAICAALDGDTRDLASPGPHPTS
jgi:dephospho-CoA kinase